MSGLQNGLPTCLPRLATAVRASRITWRIASLLPNAMLLSAVSLEAAGLRMTDVPELSGSELQADSSSTLGGIVHLRNALHPDREQIPAITGMPVSRIKE